MANTKIWKTDKHENTLYMPVDILCEENEQDRARREEKGEKK